MKDYSKAIKELKKEVRKETDIKRKTFLMATVNRYSKLMGKPEPYKW